MTLRNHAASSSLGRFAQVSIVAAASAAGLQCEPAFAGVSGETIVRGDVTFIRDGNQTIIRASDGSIIDCVSFDVLPWETVQFIQPGALSRVLNRITGPDPTVVQGQLLANGQVYIVNPAGVYFTGTAVVDVGGLYAAAGHISNEDFINGVDRFTNLTGAVVNEGIIRGGDVHLLGNRVANYGTITSDHGIITMLAGNDVYIRRHGERVAVKVDGAELTDQDRPYAGGTRPDMLATPGVENTGTIGALNNQGAVILGAGDLYALAVRNTGVIEAPGGDITLAAKDGLIHNDGLISASITDGQAGRVVLQAPSILNAGTISADSESGRAGSVQVASHNHTFLPDGSRISAAGGSGLAHGGEILVHSYAGQTVFADDAVIDVSGGALGGNGGLAEISGWSITYQGSVLNGAAQGAEHGTLIIDPYNIIINTTGGDSSFLDDAVIDFAEGGPFSDGFIKADAFSTVFGDIILRATGSVYVDAEINLEHDNNILCEALKTITVREPINGANDLFLHADIDDNGYGWVSLNVPLLIGGDAEFAGTDIIMNGHAVDGYTVATGGSQDYWGHARLGADQILTGTDIRFHDALDAVTLGQFEPPVGTNSSLTINGDATFAGAVGADYHLRFLEVNGATRLGGGLVRTDEHQAYLGATTLDATTHLVSLNGGDIRFGASVDAAAPPADAPHLIVTTAGTTRFDGPVGETGPLGSVATDAPGDTVISDDMTAGFLDFGDPVSLGDSLTLTGFESIDFASTITGFDHSLRLDSPETSFHGDVTGIDWLVTDADGTTYAATGVISADKIDFFDDLRLMDHLVITGTQYVDFHKRVWGAHHLHVISDHLVHFGGNVGDDTNDEILLSLRVDSGIPNLIDENLIVIDGQWVKVLGDILLNPAGRSRPAWVATVAARGDSLLVKSWYGDIYMGRNEKLTALGDVTLRAQNGSITAGDLNSYGDMALVSPNIRLWARKPGKRYNHFGRLVSDDGMEIISHGKISFSSVPSLLGSGAAPIVATRSGKGISGTLKGFEIRPFSELTEDFFTYGDLVLDLGFPAPTTVIAGLPPLSTANLAVAFDDEPRKIRDRVVLDPYAVRPLERLAIYMRSLNAEELVGTVDGRELYNDAQARRGRAIATVANRLRRSSVLRVIDRYSAIFLRRFEDPDLGELIEEDQSNHIRATIADAWRAYAAEIGGTADPVGLRTYLQSHPEHGEALAYCDALRDLFREIRIMGATPRELRASLNGVLGPVTPQAISQADLEKIIGLSSIG